ncbi:aminopeptidase A-like isoform X2 [Neocloeon triangulifer]|nr:aminopeptidase A-like isoform X2 [Neocloeon triangulifer]
MISRLALVLCLSFGTFGNPVVPQNFSDAAPSALLDYALPRIVVPDHYDVTLIPYFENAPSELSKFSLNGVVKIWVKLTQQTKIIRMHTYDMKNSISKEDVTVTPVSNPSLELAIASVVQSDDDKQFLTITLVNNIPGNSNLIITIYFVGKINDELDGFYRSSYVNYRGDKKWLGVTQFEPTGARRAFPCFDEPWFKATFTLHIAREPLREVTSNMPIETENAEVSGDFHKGWVWVNFKESVKMPTYLVAFAVHDFGSVGTVNKGKDYRVLARREFVDSSTSYALEKTPLIVDYMEFFTGHPYASGMKVDQIALPDFAAGAMENWGLITYREANLLHDKLFSTSANKQRILTIVAHELAHQWFGNLVSPDWWSEIWLNEGFATYFEYFASNFFETYQLDLAFIMDRLHPAFEVDSRVSTHALTNDKVDSPASATAAFDTIAYNKGAAIVRFMITVVGETNFRNGIKNYLTANEYSSVTKDKLWASLTPVVPEGALPDRVTFAQVMDTWVDLPGFPLIKVTRNYETKQMNFEQERFFSTKQTAQSPEKWFIPITFVTQKSNGNWQDTSTKGWLKPNEVLTITDNDLDKTEWVVLNPRITGYYRVQYDEENWKLITATLNDKEKWVIITDFNRAQLIDDSMALAKGEYLPYETALSLTEYLSHETEYLPWFTAIKAFSFLGDRLVDEVEDSRQFYTAYVSSKLLPLYRSVNGFDFEETDGHVKRLKKNLILQWSCNLGDDACRGEAVARFQEWKSRSSPDFQNPIDPDLRSVIYCHGMKSKEDFDFLFERYTKAQSMPSEMSTILTSLGCAPTTELLQKVLDETIKTSGSLIRSQDTRDAFVAVIRNPMGINIALDFLVTKFADIKVTYQAFGSVSRLFGAIAPKLNTEAQKAKLQKFLTDNPSEPENIKAAVRAAIAVVDENIAWLQKNKKTVLNFFEDRVGGSAGIAIVSPLLLLTAAVASYWV